MLNEAKQRNTNKYVHIYKYIRNPKSMNYFNLKMNGIMRNYEIAE